MKLTFPQTLVYWPPGVPDRSGRVAYGTPQKVPCRWEDTQEAFVNQRGEQETSAAKVFLDQDDVLEALGVKGVEFLGVMVLGEFGGLSDTDEPFKNPDAWEVRKVSKVPQLYDAWTLITVHLGTRRTPR